MQYVEVNAKDEESVENLFIQMASQTIECYKKKEYDWITEKKNYEKCGIKVMEVEYYQELMKDEKERKKIIFDTSER